MKIGIYDPYLDDLGGGEKYMMTMAEYFAKEHAVSVFWDKEEDVKELMNRFGLHLDAVPIVPNIFSPKVSLLKRLRTTKAYDVIIVLCDGSIPLSLSKKLFLHIQQPLENVQNASLISKFKLKRVTGIIYNSQFTKSYNESKFGNIQSKVIYPPVALFAQKEEKQNIILHVGRFRVKNVWNEDYKKQYVMVEAFKNMVDQGIKNWKFTLAVSVKKDDEQKFQELREQAKGYPIEFVINKTNTELWNFYNKAKIYWHASGYGEDLEKHPEFAEHFGITTVEAMGAGVVPVVIRAGGQIEIVEDNKNGFLWNTLDELIEKTKILMNDSNLLNSFSKNAQEKAKDYDKESFNKRIQKFIS